MGIFCKKVEVLEPVYTIMSGKLELMIICSTKPLSALQEHFAL